MFCSSYDVSTADVEQWRKIKSKSGKSLVPKVEYEKVQMSPEGVEARDSVSLHGRSIHPSLEREQRLSNFLLPISSF